MRSRGKCAGRSIVIRVAIVDDQALFRLGLRTLLARQVDLEIVAEAPDGAEALEAVRNCRPHVVLMDVRMPGVDGVAATARICRERPDVAVLMLTTFEDETALRDAMAVGACGYILKDTPADDIADLVRMAHRGYAVFAPTMASRLAVAGRTTPASAVLNALSTRERDVFRALGEGLSNREIAERLCVAEGTVRNHVTSILAHLRLKSRMQAALLANGVTFNAGD